MSRRVTLIIRNFLAFLAAILVLTAIFVKLPEWSQIILALSGGGILWVLLDNNGFLNVPSLPETTE